MIADKIRWAAAAGRTLRIHGAGLWSAAGRPVRSQETLSLAQHRGIVEYVAGDLTLGGPADCPKADFCLPGLKETYGIEFAEFRPLDFGGPKTVAAIDSEAVDVGVLFSLDPTIQDKGYVVLADDKNLQANGNFIPVVREEVASEELGALLDSVTTTLTDENMREMVGQILNDKRDVEDVASEYRTNAGIL